MDNIRSTIPDDMSLDTSSLPTMIDRVCQLVSGCIKTIRSFDKADPKDPKDPKDNDIEYDLAKRCATGLVCAYFGIVHECNKHGRKIFCGKCTNNKTVRKTILECAKTQDCIGYFVRNFGCRVIIKRRIYTYVNGRPTKVFVTTNCFNLRYSRDAQAGFNIYDVLLMAKRNMLLGEGSEDTMANIVGSNNLLPRKRLDIIHCTCRKHYCACASKVREQIAGFHMFIVGVRFGYLGALASYCGKDVLKLIWGLIKPTEYMDVNNEHVHYAPAMDIPLLSIIKTTAIPYIDGFANSICPTEAYRRKLIAENTEGENIKSVES